MKKITPRYTEYTGTNDIDKSINNMDNINISEEKILKEVICVIMDITNDYVNVKLNDTLKVNFPKVLFNHLSKQYLKFGQTLKYQIKIDKNGYKYQEFNPGIDTRINPEAKEIEKLLNTFKQR